MEARGQNALQSCGGAMERGGGDSLGTQAQVIQKLPCAQCDSLRRRWMETVHLSFIRCCITGGSSCVSYFLNDLTMKKNYEQRLWFLVFTCTLCKGPQVHAYSSNPPIANMIPFVHTQEGSVMSSSENIYLHHDI